MQRRTILKGAIGLAAGAALGATLPEAASAEPILVGTGCINCRPDLFPAGYGANRLPLDANHFAVEWLDWTRSAPNPIIRINGIVMKRVTEFYTGPLGWLLQMPQNGTNVQDVPMTRLCPCSNLNVEMSLWRGTVTQEGVANATPEQIMAANEARALRQKRFDYIEQWLRIFPLWSDSVYAEQADHPNEVPNLRRDKIHIDDDFATMTKVYAPGNIYLVWEDPPWR